jgi:hypothetical protein
LGGGIQI